MKKTPPYKDFFERKAWDSGHLVCGVDEVGRGCLAGPVVTASAILLETNIPDFIKDSKVLKEKERLQAFNWIVHHARYSFSVLSNSHIDRHNIYQATLHAMRKSTLQLLSLIPKAPHIILVDAMPLRLPFLPQAPDIIEFIKGEQYSSSIAAASIIAKVIRDRLMCKTDRLFPAYAFASHKGYATKKHKNALSKLGLSVIHRTSFCKTYKDRNANIQQTIC